MIGLAKREEEIIVPIDGGFRIERLPRSSHIVKLLQRIRDESHRFAVSYHTVLKRERQTKNMLEEIPGIGPLTRKKLLKTFGSMKKLTEATEADIATVVGNAKAGTIRQYIRKEQHV